MDSSRARRVLQVRVAALKKLLNAESAEPMLAYAAPGYRLALATDQLDEGRFFALVEQARTRSAAGDREAALRTLRAALELWRGEPFADVHSSMSVEAEAARLREARLVAIEDVIDVELACGHHREVAPELDALVTTNPLRERLWEQHILASYRCGRQAEALRACALVRRRLVDELGVEPGPGLRGLEASVLEQRASLDWEADLAHEREHRSSPGRPGEPLPKVRYARTADGINVAYRVVGDGPDDLIVVPGLVSHLDMWWKTSARRLIQRLASSMRVIVLDKRGLGLSDRPPDIDVHHWVEDVRAVLDAVGSSQASVLGLSTGGLVAIQLAATLPARVRSLALYGAWARLLQDHDYPFGVTGESFERTLRGIEAGWGSAVGMEELCPSASGDPVARERYGRYERMSASPGAAVSYLRALAASDVRDSLPSVIAPTLVLHSARDRSVPVEMARYVAARIPDATLVELDSADHLIWFSDVLDVITDKVQDFLVGAVPHRETNRLLTSVLFVDLLEAHVERSDALTRTPTDVPPAVAERASRLIDRFRGRCIHRSDGIEATFDGPARAVRCASTCVSDFQTAGLAARAGLHSGECDVAGGNVRGIAVQVARQIASRALPGQVLVSQTVRDLILGSTIALSAAGSLLLDGALGEWSLYAVTSI